MAKFNLTNGNYKWIAERLGNCEPEMVAAVSRVECRRDPFYEDGFPAILFERHIFYRAAPVGKRDLWMKQFPSICNKYVTPKGGYGSYAAQRQKFNLAWSLDPDSAMKACSWGAFQELGSNYAQYHFRNVGEFVDVMKNGLYGQSFIFIASIKARGLTDDMVNREFAIIARLYNGSNYKKFNYDGQIADQYKLAKRQNTDWTKVVSTEPARAKTIKISEAVSLSTVADGVFREPQQPAAPAPKPTEQPVEQPAEQPAEQPTEHNDEDHNLQVHVDKDSVDIKTDIQNKEQEKVAIVNPPSVGFVKGLWMRVSGWFGVNVGFEGATSQAQQLGALGLSSETWQKISIGLAVVGAVMVGSYIYSRHEEKKRNQRVTDALVAANTNEGNIVSLIDPELAELYEKQGYKIVTRS